MYKVYLDGKLMYHPCVADLFPLAYAKASLELNKKGTFIFTIHKSNQRYGSIQKRKSIVKIYDDDYRLFRGLVLNAKRGMHNELQVTCEGELVFFADSLVRPYEFNGSVEEYFTFLVTSHNEQVDPERQFKVGRCTVTDPNDYITRENKNYPKTLDEMQEKLVKKLGGYLWTREEEDGVYIDYLADFDTINQQDIRFGENLVTLEEVIKGLDIATAIVPLGYRLVDENGQYTGERLNIKEVNNGVDYVFSQDAVDKYGLITKPVEFDGVTLPENLKAKGEAELQNYINLIRSIDITAIDLHHINRDIRSFRMGNYTCVISEPHELDELLLTRKMELNLLDIRDGLLSLGDERRTFVDKQVDDNKAVNAFVGKVVEDCEKMVGDSIQIVENRTSSKIEQMSDEIKLQIGSTYYTKGDIETIVKQLQSSITQTAAGLQIDISKLDKDLQDKFNLIAKYFTFDINGLTIGQVDNPYKVVIDNDRYSMYANGMEVMWIANGEVYAPEITITKRFTELGYVTERDEEGRINTYYVGGDA